MDRKATVYGSLKEFNMHFCFFKVADRQYAWQLKIYSFESIHFWHFKHANKLSIDSIFFPPMRDINIHDIDN
jgi:hypothetical protein